MDISSLNLAMYISVNLFLFSSWYICLYRKKNYLSFADRLIGAFILGLSQIIITEMLLGVLFKKLFAVPLFLVNISISLVVLALAITLCRHETCPGKNKNSSLYYLEDIFCEIKDETIRIFTIIRKDLVLFSIFSLFFISICWLIFLSYLFPSYTWDSLWYHLPSIGYILQSGAIQDTPLNSFIDMVINVLPKNIDLFFLWNTIFLKSDIIVDLSQLVFTIIGILTIYSLALKLKIQEKYAIYSSLLFFFTPVIIQQSTTNYVDIAVSVIFLIAINFMMYDFPEDYAGSFKAIEMKDKKILILLSGLSSGILLGSKASGPLFVVVLSGAIVIRELIKHFNSAKITSSKHKEYFLKDRFLHYLIYFFVPVLFMGGYWYIKNWVLYNNPIYNTDITLFNITIFKGVFKGIIDPAPEVINNLSSLKRVLYVWMERVEYYLYDSRLSGFGPIWFILFLPGILFYFIYVLKREKHGFLFASGILIILFLIYPSNWNTRYVIYIVGLGALSFGLLLDYFHKREKALKIVALILALYTFLTANSPAIMPGKIREFILLSPGERTVARLAPFNIDIHARQEYGYWIWISNNISEGDTLAFTFEPLFLSPLWNRGFSNKIVYIRSDAYKEWSKELKMNNVTHVLIRTNSVEDGWIKNEKRLLSSLWWTGALKEKFKVIYADENYKIMRFGQ